MRIASLWINKILVPTRMFLDEKVGYFTAKRETGCKVLGIGFKGAWQWMKFDKFPRVGGPVEKNMIIFQMTTIPRLSVQSCSIRCQYDILKALLKKMTRTYPFGAPNIETFRTNKMLLFTCYLSYIFKSESTWMWNIWGMSNCSYVSLKDVCKVSWQDSNVKWFVGGLRQSLWPGKQIASNLMPNYHVWLWNYIYTIWDFWWMGIDPMHEWKMTLKYCGILPSLNGLLGLWQSGWPG